MHKILNAEEVLDLMLNSVSLSRYDQKFFANLQILNVLPRKPITSNQVALFKKIVQKYKNQLQKLNYDSLELSEVPWSLKVVPSDPTYTAAHIEIKNNQIILKCPYKTSFQQNFRQEMLMKWNRELKQYQTEFGLYTFKKVLQIVDKHYEDIHLCTESQSIVKEIEFFKDCDIWNPTLCRKNNYLYIAGINESLYKNISEIPLDIDLKTLSILSSYGIEIEKKLKQELLSMYDKDTLQFATQRVLYYDINDVTGLTEKLKAIGCDILCFGMHFTKNVSEDFFLKKQILDRLNVSNYIVEKSDSGVPDDLQNYSLPVFIKFNSFSYLGKGSGFFSKVIELKNNNPINLK